VLAKAREVLVVLAKAREVLVVLAIDASGYR
jgi:hypothetical protein